MDKMAGEVKRKISRLSKSRRSKRINHQTKQKLTIDGGAALFAFGTAPYIIIDGEVKWI
jgi:hypothetical protein